MTAPTSSILWMVRLDDIFIAPRQRKEHDPNKHKELVSSIQRVGLIHNLVVRPPNPGEDTEGKPWVLIAGERRIRAMRELGWTEAPCINKEDQELWQQMAMELEENTHRVDMTWQEIVSAKAKIHELYSTHVPDWTQEKSAALLGEHAGNLSRDLKLAENLKTHADLLNASSKKAAKREIDVREQAKARTSTAEKADIIELTKLLQCGDARELILKVPTASVALTLTDLPYGEDYYTRVSGRGATSTRDASGSSNYDDSRKKAFALAYGMIPEFVRVTNPMGWIVLTASSDFAAYLRHLLLRVCKTHYQYAPAKHDEFGMQVVSRGPCQPGQTGCMYGSPESPDWIWYKPGSQAISSHPELHADPKHESIVVYNRGAAKLMKPYCSTVIVADPIHSSQRIHSMQKPIELPEEILSRCTVANETVLDATFGSGIFLAAACKMSRNPIGFEGNAVTYASALALVSSYYGV